MKRMKILRKRTQRGFAVLRFQDEYGKACSLQKSSLADRDAVWFGCDDAEPRELISGRGWVPIQMPDQYVANTRMHLTRSQVKALLPYLQHFVETGDLADSYARWPQDK